MMRYSYGIEIEEAPDGVTVSCPDVPEMITCGDTLAEALARAPDALTTALSFYVDEGRPLPVPARTDQHTVSVPALVAAKLALHDAMLAARLSNVELARRIGSDEKAVRRLRDPLHRSHIDQVEAALAALGKRVLVEIAAAA